MRSNNLPIESIWRRVTNQTHDGYHDGYIPGGDIGISKHLVGSLSKQEYG